MGLFPHPSSKCPPTHPPGGLGWQVHPIMLGWCSRRSSVLRASRKDGIPPLWDPPDCEMPKPAPVLPLVPAAAPPPASFLPWEGVLSVRARCTAQRYQARDGGGPCMTAVPKREA